jgi:hypothetical protein
VKKKIAVFVALFTGLGTTYTYAQEEIPSSFVFAEGSYSLSNEEQASDTTRYVFKDLFDEKPDILLIIPQKNYTPEQIKHSATKFYNECTQQDGPQRLCRIDYCGQNDMVVQIFRTASSIPSKASKSKYAEGLRGLERQTQFVRLLRITPKGSIAWGEFEFENEDGLRLHAFGNYRSALCNLNIL